MRPLRRLIQIDEALSLIRKETKPITRLEIVSIADAYGRVSAEEIVSRVDVPPFARSAMDGYAVRASDTYGASKLKPISLRLGEVLYAGSVPKRKVKKGECAEIATGAMLPRGADSTVKVEDTERKEGHILFYEAIRRGQFVSARGTDISRRTRVVSKGDLLNPSKIGALAAIGREMIKVYSKPLVGVAPTGNEIAALGTRLRPGQVYNINSYTLAGALSANGADVRMLDIVGDSLQELQGLLKRNRDCDMIVFSGGSSVGERDLMADLIKVSGRLVFHGVAIKPGKPTVFGVVGGQLVFGMPGNPTACLSNAYVILAPTVRSMARVPLEPPRSVIARMSKRVVSTKGRTHFLTVRLEGGVAHPAFKESGAITSMAFADGYIVIPADVDLLVKGERVTVFLL